MECVETIKTSKQYIMKIKILFVMICMQETAKKRQDRIAKQIPNLPTQKLTKMLTLDRLIESITTLGKDKGILSSVHDLQSSTMLVESWMLQIMDTWMAFPCPSKV